MNDLISKLIIDENIQDIPILHICRVAIEIIKLLEEENEKSDNRGPDRTN